MIELLWQSLLETLVMPAAAGFFKIGKAWTRMGPFDLGPAYRPIAALSLIFCAVLLYSGVQPPNDQALTVTVGAIASRVRRSSGTFDH